jgi:hypothetical protein
MSGKKIIWLASYPKSGNTWFRVFLSNLLSEKEEPVHLNQLHSTPIASGRTLFDENAGVSSSDLSLEEIENLRPGIYREITSNSEDLIYQKVHDAWKLAPSGEPLFPANVTKAVVYFIRNPLDVTVSFAHHSSATLEKTVKEMNDPDNAFCEKPGKLYNQLRQDLLNWSGHVNSWVNDSGLSVVVLRYEDILDNPYREFKKALDFIGLDFSENKIRSAIENAEFNKLKELEAKEGFNEKPIKMQTFFREGRSGSYRNHLDNNLVKEIISVHGEVMRRYRYL